ncbi:MAG TPA: sporulation integral membrane protein YtvI [Clostridiales bacterium]|nr:sporulation integral membrane protein YtvI [Clostridiales bacterium]
MNRNILIKAAQVILVVAALYLILTKLILVFAPFLAAFLIANLAEKPAGFLRKHLKFSRGAASALSLFVFVLLAGTLIWFLFSRLFMEVWELTKDSSSYQHIMSRIKDLIDTGGTWYAGLPEEVGKTIESNFENILSKLGKVVTDAIDSLLKGMLAVLTSLPQAFLYIVITLVAAFFISRDREKISRFLFSQLPLSWRSKVKAVKDDLLLALVGYIKAVLILVTITFFEVLAGYTILGVKYAFFLAILTAVADLLPVLGPGTVLIPGAVIYLINGNIFMAVGFFILYILVTIVRQFLEPRIVGENIGLHPLVTLLCIYLGYRIFGLSGLILGPVFAIVVKSLQKAGILPSWKTS